MSTSKHPTARKKNLAGVPPLNVLSPYDRALRERIKALMLEAGIVGYRNGNTFVYYHRGRSKDLAGRLTIETPRTGDDWLTSFYHAAVYATLHAAVMDRPVAARFPAFCEALGLDPRGEGLRAWEYAGQVDGEMRKFLGDARYGELLRAEVSRHAATRDAPGRARFVLRVTQGGFIALERSVPNASLGELANALRGGFREGEFRKSAKGYAFLPRNDEYRDTPGALALELARQLRDAGVSVAVAQDKDKSSVKKNGRPAVGGTMSSMSSKGTGARRWTMPDIKRANAAAGRHYFSRDTQRFFGPETYHGPYQGPGGVYFVKVGQRTGIKVVQFDPATGDVDTVHNMPAPTLDEGRKMAKAAAAGAKPNGRAAEPANEVEAEELVLYTANERALYDRRKAFYDSALRKVRAGTYDPAKAPALFVYLADEAAKHYRTAYHMGTGFSPATRRLAAEKFAREFEGSDEYAEAVAAKGQRGKGKAAARKRNAGAVVRRTFTVQPGSGYYIVNQRRPTGGYDVVARLDTEGDAEALVGALDNAIDEYLRDNHGRHLRNPGARATHRSYDVEPYSGYYRVVERKDGRPGLHVILSGLSENDAVSVADALHNVLVAFQRDNGYAMRKANGARHARPEFTAHDLAVIAQTADRIRYSEDTPETVMLSTGYADVYPEGDHEASVTIHGVNWTFEEQQLHPERFRVKATRR